MQQKNHSLGFRRPDKAPKCLGAVVNRPNSAIELGRAVHEVPPSHHGIESMPGGDVTWIPQLQGKSSHERAAIAVLIPCETRS
jgi:hypothetical protein